MRLVMHVGCPYCMLADSINAELGEPFSTEWFEEDELPDGELDMFRHSTVHEIHMPHILFRNDGGYYAYSVPYNVDSDKELYDIMRGFMETLIHRERELGSILNKEVEING